LFSFFVELDKVAYAYANVEWQKGIYSVNGLQLILHGGHLLCVSLGILKESVQ
jgi:hypothetical protein